MRLPFFIVLTYISLGVAGNGLRNAYEHMWLWYAYQIDLLNPVDQRTVGVRCARWEAGACVDDLWVPCTLRPQGAGGVADFGATHEHAGTCSFREFLSWITNIGYYTQTVLGGRGDREAERNLFPDMEATAQGLVDRRRHKNYATYRAVKDCPEKDFVQMISRVGAAIGNTRAAMTPQQLDANKQLLDMHDESMNKILWEREIDHHPFLIDHLRQRLEVEYDEHPDQGKIILMVDDLGTGHGSSKKQMVLLQNTLDYNSKYPGVRDWLPEKIEEFYTPANPADPSPGEIDRIKHRLVIREFKVST